MSGGQSDVVVAQTVVGLGILTEDQARAALSESFRDNIERPLSEYLLAKQLLTPEQFWQLEKTLDEALEKSSRSKPRIEVETAPPSAVAPQQPAVAPEQPAVAPQQPAVAPEQPAAEPSAAQHVSGSTVWYQPGIALEELLRQAALARANDFHLHSGARLKVRLDGRLEDISEEPIDASEAGRLLNGLLDEATRAALGESSQVDFVYSAPGVGRFRANVYRQQRGLDAVFRPISERPPTLAGLGLPETLEQFTKYHQGLVLLTGPAGCGKSSTMAALVDLINETRRQHIITVEDPIEHLHESKRCTVNQRQVGRHTENFARALRAALREDPDVIVVGELRDLETVSLALTAAETGHLVLGTLHTNNAVRTINRILGVFPSEQQPQIRMMVSESLIAVISQRLLARADRAGRVAAVEVLINNNAIGNLIRDEKTFQIPSLMQTATTQGMVLLDNALAHLVEAGMVNKEEARGHAEEPSRFD